MCRGCTPALLACTLGLDSLDACAASVLSRRRPPHQLLPAFHCFAPALLYTSVLTVRFCSPKEAVEFAAAAFPSYAVLIHELNASLPSVGQRVSGSYEAHPTFRIAYELATWLQPKRPAAEAGLFARLMHALVKALLPHVTREYPWASAYYSER